MNVARSIIPACVSFHFLRPIRCIYKPNHGLCNNIKHKWRPQSVSTCKIGGCTHMINKYISLFCNYIMCVIGLSKLEINKQFGRATYGLRGLESMKKSFRFIGQENGIYYM